MSLLELAVDRAAVRYDRQGDQHYDVISAFIKSIRGSDVDAALHYLARMIAAGEDPRFIARRLVISASEDIGLADPTALPIAVAAAQAVQLIGMPEARINLAHAVIALSLAPKSNAVIIAVDEAIADVSGRAHRRGSGASARRPLSGRQEARPRVRVPLRARRPTRRRAAASCARRGGRSGVLPADARTAPRPSTPPVWSGSEPSWREAERPAYLDGRVAGRSSGARGS